MKNTFEVCNAVHYCMVTAFCDKLVTYTLGPNAILTVGAHALLHQRLGVNHMPPGF